MKLGIVGLGQSGIVLAHSLLQSEIQITLIDAGDFKKESGLLNRSSYLFRTQSSMPDGVHMVGGGARLWYGRVSKFPDYVFDNSYFGWPIDSKSLSHYYSSIYKIMGLGEVSDLDISNIYNSELASKLGPDLQLSPYFQCEPHYYERLLVELINSRNVEFILNSPIKEIEVNSKEKVNIVGFNGESYCFDKLVVSGGTIQSTSLLLRSLKNLSKVENSHLIGKGLMEHFDGYVGCYRFRKKNEEAVKDLVKGSSSNQTYLHQPTSRYGFGIKLSHKYFQSTTAPMLDFHLHFERYQEIYMFGDLYFLLPRNNFIKKILFACEVKYRKIILIPMRNLFDRVFGFTRYSLYLKGEELPNVSSHIAIPLFGEMSPEFVKYNHRISKLTTSAIRISLRTFREQFHFQFPGKIKYYRWFISNPGCSYTGPNWHPMGTMPMNVDFEKRVVNHDLSLTGYPSIYMLHAGVFPSGSYQNPSTTTLALALRLADQLIADYKSVVTP